MTIETLHDDRLLITLGEHDMTQLGLSIERMDPSDPATRRALMRLIVVACRGCGIDCRSRRFLIEALPVIRGVMLLVSMPRRRERRRYRIKHPAHAAGYIFDSADDMLDGLRRVPRAWLIHCRMYTLDQRYVLIPARADADVDALLCEYACRCRLTAFEIARIGERAVRSVTGERLARSFGQS